jgi:hypothetical protein
MLLAQFAGRSGLHVGLEVVEVAGHPLRHVASGRFLLEDVRHVLLTKGSIVEPVVAHPAVDHRVHRHSNLERRMRMIERHQRQESVVGDAEYTDLAVALGNVLHQPVNGVVRVGRFVDRSGVLRTVDRPVHHEVAFGSILAPNVLDHTDVAVLDDHVGRIVVPFENRPQMSAGSMAGQHGGVIRSPRQQHSGMLRAVGFDERLRQQDHRVQLHAIAHRDHNVAPLVVENRRRRRELRRSLAGIVGILCRLSSAGQHDSGESEGKYSDTTTAKRQGHQNPLERRGTSLPLYRGRVRKTNSGDWWRRMGSNHRPWGYESHALTS